MKRMLVQFVLNMLTFTQLEPVIMQSAMNAPQECAYFANRWNALYVARNLLR